MPPSSLKVALQMPGEPLMDTTHCRWLGPNPHSRADPEAPALAVGRGSHAANTFYSGYPLQKLVKLRGDLCAEDQPR